MRLLDDCFIFTEMISNQFDFGSLSRDLFTKLYTSQVVHFSFHQVYDRLPIERFGLSIWSLIPTSTPQETLKKMTEIP